MASFRTVLTGAVLLVLLRTSSAQLSGKDFYSKTCPTLTEIVKNGVYEAMQKETQMGASLLRLYFHDCFVNGCDASVLLDDTNTLIGEKTVIANNNSARGFQVIDAIKSAVEEHCPDVVSCADILAIAARDSVVQLGGPHWEMKLGRRDAKTASFDAANKGIPTANWTQEAITSRFNRLGLSTTDFTALIGSHGLRQDGRAPDRAQMYKETKKLRSIKLDNNYFQQLLQKTEDEPTECAFEAGLVSSTNTLEYAKNLDAFHLDFAKAMVKLGDISPLTGSQGEVRKNCRRVN